VHRSEREAGCQQQRQQREEHAHTHGSRGERGVGRGGRLVEQAAADRERAAEGGGQSAAAFLLPSRCLPRVRACASAAKLMRAELM
jgi:hypothetical protein